MSEIADLMINGDICECCGEELDGVGEGFPRYCSKRCANYRNAVWVDPPKKPNLSRKKKGLI